MADIRYKELAGLLVNYSMKVQPGENALIEVFGQEEALTKELIKAVYAAGGRPFVMVQNDRFRKLWLEQADEQAVRLLAERDRAFMRQMDCYCGLRLAENKYDMAELSDEANERFVQFYAAPVHMQTRVPHTKWVVLRYPNAAMAQEAHMSTDAFADYYFRVCNFDYPAFSKAMDPLHQLLCRGERVQIRGRDVELSFSIKGMGAVKCDGEKNIPDGEVYTAPVKDSVEGYITYNTPSPENGKTYERVHLRFERGRIVECSCAGGEELQKSLAGIFDTDEGARYIGEFAFGLHPIITEPMGDTLFDEKISGSFHFTPGNSYDDCDNGNKSAVHWDMVYIMRPEYGGCEIWLDGELIQKDGVFVPDSLQGLNAGALKKLCF
ncbi:MAG: aminopeptidase [Bacillota bacterium]|nr:aminopeptidase [Bacillota bacterium]